MDHLPPELRELTIFMLRVVWAGMLGGVVSGALVGLFFHREEWMGGYGSFRRRLTRLGHISFFGLGFVNFLFAGTVFMLAPNGQGGTAWFAAHAFTLAAVTMPLCCFLTAWRKEPFRHFFFIPVSGALLGIAATLYLVFQA